MFKYYKNNNEFYISKKEKRLERIKLIETRFNVSWDKLSINQKNSLGVKFSREQDPSIQQRISDSLRKRHAKGLFVNAIKAIKDRIWITDGVNSQYIKKDSEIPYGFKRGRTYKFKNHKIVNIEIINKCCDVYDLEIEDNSNFALSAGVFVHNSKDVADAVASVCYHAAQGRPGLGFIISNN
jgi:hypothetical protein